MPGDRAQGDRSPGRIARVAGRDPDDTRERVDVIEVETPGDQRDEGGPRRGRDPRRAEVADYRDSDRAGVEALCVGADHGPRHTAVAAFEDLAVLVDEEVVTDVVPAVPLHVVQLDRLHDRGRLGLRVRVRPGRVVDDCEMNRIRIERRPSPNRLVRVPAGARDDRRRPCQVGALGPQALPRAAHEVRPHPGDAANRPVLDAVRGTRPEGARDAPTAARSALRAVVRKRILGRERPPRAPTAREVPRPVLDHPRPLPMQADELEYAGRDRLARRLRREISRHQPGTKGGPGEGGGEDGCDDERPHPRRRSRCRLQHARARSRGVGTDASIALDPLRGSHTPSWPARENPAR